MLQPCSVQCYSGLGFVGQRSSFTTDSVNHVFLDITLCTGTPQTKLEAQNLFSLELLELPSHELDGGFHSVYLVVCEKHEFIAG